MKKMLAVLLFLGICAAIEKPEDHAWTAAPDTALAQTMLNPVNPCAHDSLQPSGTVRPDKLRRL